MCWHIREYWWICYYILILSPLWVSLSKHDVRCKLGRVWTEALSIHNYRCWRFSTMVSNMSLEHGKLLVVKILNINLMKSCSPPLKFFKILVFQHFKFQLVGAEIQILPKQEFSKLLLHNNPFISSLVPLLKWCLLDLLFRNASSWV